MNGLTTPIPTVHEVREKIIHFPEGLPGFPNHREFVMAQQPEERPFAWMRSVEDASLTFAVVDAYAWNRDYMLEIDDAELKALGSLDPMDYAVYFILRVEKDGAGTKLKAKPNAPVLVNIKSRQARQVVVPLNASLEKAEALCLSL